MTSFFSARVALIAACLFSLVLYALTLSAGYGVHDEAEYSLRAWQLGATHSPGAPLYVFLAHIAVRLTGNPALATGIVSAVSAVLLTGVVTTLLNRQLGPPVAFAGGALFATNFLIWRNAVLSEPYALSALLAVAGFAALIDWNDRGSRLFPVAAFVLYAGSLAAHFANILLLPACLLLVGLAPRSRRAGILMALTWCGLAAAAILVIALANVALARNQLPWAENLPVDFAGVLRYMLGAQHDPLRVSSAGFLMHRVIEHLEIIFRQTYFVVPLLAIPGAWRQATEDRFAFLALFLLAGTYLGYFTLFGSGDYFTMVAPAYVVIIVWALLGLDRLTQLAGKRQVAIAVLAALLVATVATAHQLPGRFREARSPQAPRMVTRVFDLLPADALVIAKYSDFTSLRYAQVVEGQRPDLILILPAEGARTYAHGVVEDFLAYAAAVACERPVATNRVDERIGAIFDYRALDATETWYLLTREGCPNEWND